MAKPSRTQRPDVSHLSRRTVLQRGVTAGASLAMGSLPAVPRRSLHAAQATPIPGTNLHDGEWIAYGRDPGGMRHSPLDQITRENVQNLTVAWTYHTGELALYDDTSLADSAAFEATPLMVDGALYFSTPSNRVIALDAATGAERWVFDPRVDLTRDYAEVTSRGVSTWVDPGKSPGDPGYRRLFLGTLDGRLLALDADSGQPSAGFGEQGAVDLTVGVNLRDPGNYLVTSPPAIVGDLVVVGSAIGDNRAVESERGIVRAYRARDGALAWGWDPIPRDSGAPGYDTWNGPVAHKTGGANAWAPISADPERDLVFVPTSAPSPDYYGGERLGQNLFANCVVALRASTGEMIWHFQTVHHDIWDYDVPMQPALIAVNQAGETVPAVAVGTKQGHVFVLHRETGEPLYPVEERPVPQTDVPGEETWPTQPFPAQLPLFGLRELTPDDAWGPSPEAVARAQEVIAALRSEGPFTPISLQGTIQTPSNAGGFNWGGLSYDPARQLLVGAVNRFAAVMQLIPRDEAGTGGEEGERFGLETAQQLGTPYTLARSLLLDPETMLPLSPPPWGTLAAVDLGDGSLAWEVPLGLVADPTEVPDAVNWGSPHLGGPTTTGGGLAFVAATLDGIFRAFDVETGDLLWQDPLPAGGQATPMSYETGGRQFVAIAAGGHGRLGSQMGDAVVAYALPDTTTAATPAATPTDAEQATTEVATRRVQTYRRA
jgi:quinoprotein glucose dehydrogenase